MVKALLLDKKNQSPAPTPVKAVEEVVLISHAVAAHSYQLVQPPLAMFIGLNIHRKYVLQAAQLSTTKNHRLSSPISNQIRLPVFPRSKQYNVQIKGNNQKSINNQTEGTSIKLQLTKPPDNKGQNLSDSRLFQPPAYQAPAIQAPALRFKCIEEGFQPT
ncbi:hypothetical protein Tco_0067470 [Tanacetum coccineum]